MAPGGLGVWDGSRIPHGFLTEEHTDSCTEELTKGCTEERTDACTDSFTEERTEESKKAQMAVNNKVSAPPGGGTMGQFRG